MTVKALIEELEKCDGDYTVYVPSLLPYIEGEHTPVSDVDISNSQKEVTII